MATVFFENHNQKADGTLQYVVVAARYQDQWVFVRHKQRETWEIPGGHIETGETPENAARRELWEETGALQTEIHPICIYGVSRHKKTTYGMLYFAEIQIWEALPEAFEIGERRLYSSLPGQLTYPEIQPALFERVQIWRNHRSNAGE